MVDKGAPLQQEHRQQSSDQEQEALIPELEESEETEAEDQEAASRLSSQQASQHLGTEVGEDDGDRESGGRGFSLSMFNPKKAIYDARLAAPGRKKRVLSEGHEISNADIVLEQLAHNGAYARLDNRKLPAWGYREMGAVEDPESGFRAVLYVPTTEAESGDSERAQKIRAIHGGAPEPVLAFRGTDSGRALSDDVNREGIGTYQFASNTHKVEQMLAAAGGKCIVTGHSLGGALAQICACRYPSGVSRVVTFQSPGIDEDEAAKLKDHNAEAAPEDAIKSTHHRADGDLVHVAGEALTEGDVFEFDSVGFGWAGDHTSFPLARLNAARGDLVEGVGDSKGGKVGDKLVGISKSDADEEKDSWVTDAAEWARENLGAIFRDPDMEPYVRMWDTVKQMCEAGIYTLKYILGIIDISDKLTDVQKVKMRDAVKTKYF